MIEMFNEIYSGNRLRGLADQDTREERVIYSAIFIPSRLILGIFLSSGRTGACPCL